MPISDQGINTRRYSTIPRVLIFITHHEQVLLIKGSAEKKLWSEKFNGIGGHIEPGEDPLTAAYRELFEETGLSRSNLISTSSDIQLWLCGILLVDSGKNPGVCIFIFSGESEVKSVQESLEGTLHWINEDHMDTLPVVEDLSVILKKIKSMKPGDNPFFASSKYNSGRIEVTFSTD